MNVRKDLLLFECVPLHAEGMLVFHHISSATYCCIPAQRCWAQQIMELGDLHLLRVFVQVDVKNHSPFSFCLSVPISVSPAFMSPQAAPYMLHLGVGPSLATLKLGLEISRDSLAISLYCLFPPSLLSVYVEIDSAEKLLEAEVKSKAQRSKFVQTLVPRILRNNIAGPITGFFTGPIIGAWNGAQF